MWVYCFRFSLTNIYSIIHFLILISINLIKFILFIPRVRRFFYGVAPHNFVTHMAAYKPLAVLVFFNFGAVMPVPTRTTFKVFNLILVHLSAAIAAVICCLGIFAFLTVIRKHLFIVLSEYTC